MATVSASPSATPSASPVATASAKITATPSAKPTATVSGVFTVAKPKVKILSTKFLQNGKEVLRVRSSPDATSNTLGYAPVGNEYSYLKEKVEDWYKISFDNKPGWVSTQYTQLIE